MDKIKRGRYLNALSNMKPRPDAKKNFDHKAYDLNDSEKIKKLRKAKREKEIEDVRN